MLMQTIEKQNEKDRERTAQLLQQKERSRDEDNPVVVAFLFCM